MSDPEYRRGYSNGYAAGCKRADRENAAERDRADRAVLRAELAEAQHGVGHCENCRWWVKVSEVNAWGNCTVPRSAGWPWGCWAQSQTDGKGISTSPRFGCVLFLPAVLAREETLG